MTALSGHCHIAAQCRAGRTRAPSGTWPPRVGSPQTQRRGFTLVETVCIISVVGTLLTLSSVLLNRAYSVHRTTLTAFRELEQLNHWCLRFRADARRATQVELASGIQLIVDDGRTIHYWVEDQRLIRSVQRQSQTLSREAWQAWPVDRARWRIATSGRVPLVSCRLEFADARPGREPIQWWARMPALELPLPLGDKHEQ